MLASSVDWKGPTASDFAFDVDWDEAATKVFLGSIHG